MWCFSSTLDHVWIRPIWPMAAHAWRLGRSVGRLSSFIRTIPSATAPDDTRIISCPALCRSAICFAQCEIASISKPCPFAVSKDDPILTTIRLQASSLRCPSTTSIILSSVTHYELNVRKTLPFRRHLHHRLHHHQPTGQQDVVGDAFHDMLL